MEPSGTNTRKDFHKKLYERALSGDSEDTKGVFWSCLSGEECRVLVVVAMRVHLLPFRTQKLSSSALMIVGLNSRKSKSPPRPCISHKENHKNNLRRLFFLFSFFLFHFRSVSPLIREGGPRGIFVSGFDKSATENTVSQALPFLLADFFLFCYLIF